MMATQAFLYNAIFFTYALVLEHFYGVPKGTTSYYFFPFAIGNLLGPLLLGGLFDTIGRRKMITFTYGSSGRAVAGLGLLIQCGRAECDHADDVLVCHFLPRVGRRIVGLPDGERDISARASRAGDLLLLRDRSRRRWLAGALAVRPPHRRPEQSTP